jgi:ribosomal protein S18 acetylase RimI-like enzyme
MDIRELSEGDAEAFRALRLRALREHPEAFGASYEDMAARPLERIAEQLREAHASADQCNLGAFDADGRLVGMVGFWRNTSSKTRHRGMIWGMYTAPEVRGTGAGRALLNELIGRARAMPGVEQMHLDVVTSNTAARTLYLSAGFEVYGLDRRALKLPDGTYLDEEKMVLWLDAGEVG